MMYSIPVHTCYMPMATETTPTQLRSRLKRYLDEAVSSREPVMIRRRKGEDVALIAADELRGLLETMHLFRSPKNAARLLKSFADAERGKGAKMTMEQLRRAVGMDA